MHDMCLVDPTAPTVTIRGRCSNAVPLWPPGRKYAVDRSADLVAGLLTGHACHQQLVVVGVLVPDRGDDGGGDGVLLEGAASGASSDPAAAAGAGVLGDRLGAFARAGREEPADLGGEFGLKVQIRLGTSYLLSFAAASADVGVGQALLLGRLQSRALDQQALTL